MIELLETDADRQLLDWEMKNSSNCFHCHKQK